MGGSNKLVQWIFSPETRTENSMCLKLTTTNLKVFKELKMKSRFWGKTFTNGFLLRV